MFVYDYFKTLESIKIFRIIFDSRINKNHKHQKDTDAMALLQCHNY
jgi:hypothetical protein